MPRQGNKGKSFSGSKSVKLGPGFPPQLLNRLLRSQRRCIPFRNTFLTMYNTSQCSRGIPNKSDSEQKYDNFYYSSPKAATDMGVSSSESHDLTAFYEMLTASFGVLSQNTGFYPSLDRIVETTLGPLNLGPGGGSYNKPISHLQHNELCNVGPPVLTNVLLSISLLNYTAHPPILAGPDEAAPLRQQLNQYKFTMEWLVEHISHVAQPNCTLQLRCFEMICHAIHTYKLCAINCPKNVMPDAVLESLLPVISGCMDRIIQLIPVWVEEAPGTVQVIQQPYEREFVQFTKDSFWIMAIDLNHKVGEFRRPASA